MGVWVKVGVMDGVRVTVAVSVGGRGVVLGVAVVVGASNIIPLHPARSAVNKIRMEIR